MTGRFSTEEIIDYLEDTASQTLLSKFEKRRRQAPDYESLLQLLDRSKKQHAFSRTQLDKTYRKLRIAERNEFLLRFYSGNMTAEDNYILINELNVPTSKMVESILEDMQMGTDESQSLCAEALLSEGEVLQIVTGAEAVSPVSDANKTTTETPVRDIQVGPPRTPQSSRDSFEWLSWLKPATGLAFAALLIGLLTQSAITFFRTTYKLNSASTLLLTNYRIHKDEVPRLSGGYGSTGLELTLGERAVPDEVRDQESDQPQLLIENEKNRYLEDALKKGREALQNGADHNDAYLIQAQIFFINNQLDHTELYLQKLDSATWESPVAQNTRGLVAFSREQWRVAADLFQAAITTDPQLREGFYNLALAYRKLGQNENAVSAMERYLTMETETEWLIVARGWLKNFKQD